MTMHKSIYPTAFAVLLVLSSAAVADDAGFYFGVGIGQASANLTGKIDQSLIEEGFSIDSLSLNGAETGWKLFAGYAFTSYLAAELSYVDLGEAGAEITIGGRVPGRIDTTMDMSGINIGLKLNYPFDDQFFAFIKLGAFVWNAEANANANLGPNLGTSSRKDNGADFSYGLGLSYAFTDQVTLRADWDYYRLGGDADADAKLWSVGMQYLF